MLYHLCELEQVIDFLGMMGDSGIPQTTPRKVFHTVYFIANLFKVWGNPDSIVKNIKNLKGVLDVYPFGHVADGNIHLIVGKENNSEILTQNINDTVYQPLQEIKGSISAEHGIGIDKKPYLHLSRTKPEMELMKAIKLLLDPKNILNPARIIN